MESLVCSSEISIAIYPAVPCIVLALSGGRADSGPTLVGPVPGTGLLDLAVERSRIIHVLAGYCLIQMKRVWLAPSDVGADPRPCASGNGYSGSLRGTSLKELVAL